MSALQPKNLRHYPFGGSAASGTTYYLGASGSTFLPGGSDDRTIADMGTNDIVVAWEIRNNDGSNNLLVRFGPDTGTFTAAAGAVLDNYVTLPAGITYYWHAWPEGQQVNDQVGGVDYSILLIQGNGGTCDYTGVATVWSPSDE